MVWTNPRTWVAGEKPSAATLNTHIRDNLKALSDAWTTYAATWTAATTNPVIGNGTFSSFARQIDKMVDFNIEITMGSTTTYGTGGVYNISLPVAPKRRLMVLGSLRDTSASATYLCFLEVAAGSTQGTLRVTSGVSPVTLTTVSNTSPATWATGDIFQFAGSYEAA